MARQSPSGPGVITDKFYQPIGLTGAEPPNDYFVLPLVIATLAGTFVIPTTDPFGEALPLLFGPETRDGRIGKCRIAYGVDVPGSDPLEFQWNVNGVLVGAPVVVSPLIIAVLPTTYADVAALVKGDPYNFPGASWKAGDVVALQLKVGTLTFGASAISFAYEKNYP
jgi:hypothetical protein